MTRLNPEVLRLAEQAKGFVDLNQHVGANSGCMIYTYEGLNKFAELIVRECADQCADNGSSDEWDKGVRWAANQIKQHFGIEE